MHYPKSMIEKWKNKLALHESWWRNKRERTAQNPSIKKSWRPSPFFIEKYFRLARGNGTRRMILDVGCGEGYRARHFHSIIYIGIDPLVLKDGYAFPFLEGMGEYLPFRDDIFDAVIAIEVFDHILDPVRAVSEILRVLKIGGNLHIFVGFGDKEDSQVKDERKNSPFFIKESDVHLHIFTESDFKSLILNRFSVLEIDNENEYLAVWGWNKE